MGSLSAFIIILLRKTDKGVGTSLLSRILFGVVAYRVLYFSNITAAVPCTLYRQEAKTGKA